MYLYHDHRERVNVRFLAECPLFQDLWCCPQRGVATPTRGTPCGIWVLSNCSVAKIRNPCTIGVVHEDVCLVRCQYYGKRFGTVTYSLEVSMYYIAGVDVAEAISDIR